MQSQLRPFCFNYNVSILILLRPIKIAISWCRGPTFDGGEETGIGQTLCNCVRPSISLLAISTSLVFHAYSYAFTIE